jgi:predicted permease
MQDLRLAIRLLYRDRAFSLTTLLTLALCIGANSAIFTVVRSVMLKPLPYPQSGELTSLFDSFPGAGVERAGTSVPNYFDRLALTEAFDSLALYQFDGVRVGRGAGSQSVRSINVTPSFFRVLRTRAGQGRLFTEEEGQTGRGQVVVVSHDFARGHAGRPEAMVGRDLQLDDQRFTVVGVLAADFSFLDPEVRIYRPLAFTEDERAEERRYSQNHQAIGRLAPGATLASAQARLDALNARNLERAGSLKSALLNAGYHSKVSSLHADLLRNVRPALQLLWVGVLFVLLIAAVNVTNLWLARTGGRVKELAVRHVLGASGGRLTRQLVTEMTVLTLGGGLLGLGLAYASLGGLSALGLADIPRAHEIRMDAGVVQFTLALSLVVGLLVGLVPALHLRAGHLGRTLREDGRTGTAGRGARQLRRVLVVAEVALAFVLLVGGGLLLASFRQLLQVDPGFVAERVLTGRVAPLREKYPDDAALRAYTRRALEAVRALPGVASAGVSSFLPFSTDSSSSVIIAEGYVPAPGESIVSPNTLYVSPGYLETLRAPLKRGRFFTDADQAPAPAVIIVDEKLAQKFWPGADPLGRRMYLPENPEDVLKPGPSTVWLRVVGVVGTMKIRGLVEGEEARAGAYYLPYAQQPSRRLGFAVRASGDSAPIAAAVQRALVAVDPETPLTDVIALPDRIERSLNPRRAPMLMSLGFGGVALLLALIGIYGVLAYQVSQRTREIGIRMALGSDVRGILRLFLREGVALVLLGLAIGFAGAVAVRGFIASQLYGVGPLDARVIGLVAGLLLLAATLACLAPARRAARTDPLVALAQP